MLTGKQEPQSKFKYSVYAKYMNTKIFKVYLQKPVFAGGANGRD